VIDDHDRMRENLARVFPGNEAGLDKFLAAEKRRFDRLSPCFETDYSDFRKMFGRRLRHALPVLSLGKSVADVLKDYFPSPDAQKAFMFQTKYLGMSPWECPAAFGIIPYVEHAFGIYHVQGGLARIPEAMAKVVEEEGGRVLLGRQVKEVLMSCNKAKGVVTEDGERFETDAVVLNADFAHSALNLFPEGSLKHWTKGKLEKKRFSCSTFMLYLGLDKLYRDLPHHGIFFAKDYRRNIEEIFRDLTLPEDPSFYLRNSSLTDPTVAPDGHSAIYVLVPVPNLRADIDWAAKRDEFRERVLDTIERQAGITDFRAHIKEERVITPPEWQDSGVHLGATFNLAHNLGQMLWFRPRNRFEDASNCYLVGGGTHPGSGLPTIFESGRISAGLIEKDLR
jgi:phytoene desaturase